MPAVPAIRIPDAALEQSAALFSDKKSFVLLIFTGSGFEGR
jgi:hypothetical protein